MAPPSKLIIGTRSLERLVQEEKSYHRELEQQESSVLKSKDGDDENAEFVLKQQKRAIEETRAIFPKLEERIRQAIQDLEAQLATAKDEKSSTEDIIKAEEAIAHAKSALRS